MNWLSLPLSIFLTCAVAGPTASAQNLKSDEWLADFSQLKLELSGHYANLDWAVEARKLDLRSLSEQTEARLRQAGTDAEAKRAIESFLDAFGDGHLTVQWPAPKPQPALPPAPTESVKRSLCEALDFKSQNLQHRVQFTELTNFRAIDAAASKYFPIGVLTLADNRRVGVLRIAIFSEYWFPDLCEQSVTQLGLTQDSPCDEACRDRVERESANLLTKALADQVAILKLEKIGLLLVDITGNGGGTNWAEPAARTLSAKPLRSPRQLFIRHEHWVKQLEQRLTTIKAAVANPGSPDRQLLTQGRAVLEKAVSEAQRTCVRDSVWENRKPACSLVVTAPTLFPQSVLPFAKQGSLSDSAASRFLFFPSRYRYDEGVYSGRLAVLVDYGTWSSAEYFAAMLRDNGAATIIGAPTGGAGCGYTNGGIPTILKNSQAKVKIPDCVRLRADDSNEVAGITPDVPIPWRPNDNRYQRAKRVADALSVVGLGSTK